MIYENLKSIRERIEAAAERSGRSKEKIRLVAVSKRKDIELIRQAIAAGQKAFGENYVQEAALKIEILNREYDDLEWHFIGRLQRNKAKAAAGLFDCLETIDSLRLAEAVDRHSRAVERKLDVFVQVNIAREPQKAGLAPEELISFFHHVSSLQFINIKGLMTIPPYSADPEDSRKWFRGLRELQDKINEQVYGKEILTELSMGMSNDFEVAIEEGATVVRVGTAIFGPRS